jgi:hypothetical protein
MTKYKFSTSSIFCAGAVVYENERSVKCSIGLKG